MPEMMPREILDNRIIRAGGELGVSAGRAARAVFDTPMMTGLVAQKVDLAEAAGGRWTPEQYLEHAREEQARNVERDQITLDLRFETDPAERERLMDRIFELQAESDLALDTATRESIEEGRMATPEDLTEKYGDLGLTFDRPMAVAEARLLAENKRAEIVRQSIMEAGPGGVVPGAMKFGAGLAAMAVDPLEVASMFIPVVTPARMAVLTARLGRVGGRVAAGAIEGLVGSAVTEPFYYTLSREQQLDYTMADALFNVGLGAVFGAGIGATGAALTRGGAPARGDVPGMAIEAVSADLRREAADTALRQFVTGQRVNITRLLDGTDLRSTTTLSRVNGVEFQARRVVDLPTQGAPRLSVIATDEKGARRAFETVQKADAFAEKVGGTVHPSGKGYVVRQPVDGDLIRDPVGQPTVFQTKRKAEKFVAAARNLTPEDNHVVPIQRDGKQVWGVTRDMDEKTALAVAGAGDDLRVPDGLNTREAQVLPDANARMDQVIRGVAAKTLTAKTLAAESASDASDLVASRPASDIAAEYAKKAEPAPELSSEYVEPVKDIASRVGDLTEEERALLEAVDKAAADADVFAQVARVAANCVLRG